jgi:hypothetical protein
MPTSDERLAARALAAAMRVRVPDEQLDVASTLFAELREQAEALRARLTPADEAGRLDLRPWLGRAPRSGGVSGREPTRSQ